MFGNQNKPATGSGTAGPIQRQNAITPGTTTTTSNMGTGFGSTFGSTNTTSTGFGTNFGSSTNSSFGQNKGFSFGQSNFSFGGQNEKPIIDENQTLAAISGLYNDDEEKKKAKDQALKILIELHETVNQYGQKVKPLEGAEAFEKRLSELEDDATKAVHHTIMTLANEIDHGNAIISEYRDELDTSRSDFNTAVRGSRTLPSPFLVRFADSLQKRASNLNEAIHSFEQHLEVSSPLKSPQELIHVLQQQHDAIIRCSARISQIKEKSNEIQKKVKTLLPNRNINESTLDEYDKSEQERSSFAKTVLEDYNRFKSGRIRDLEKRNTNPEQFKTKQGTNQNTFSFSFGSKPNTGSTSSTLSSFNFGNKTNTTNTSSNTGTSTPAFSFGNNTK